MLKYIYIWYMDLVPPRLGIPRFLAASIGRATCLHLLYHLVWGTPFFFDKMSYIYNIQLVCSL